MSSEHVHALVDLDDVDLTVAEPAEDLRGRRVIERDGADIGTVDGLLVDEEERRVRFLQVGSGGWLGLGRKSRLIPTNAITGADDEVVAVDTTREHVAAGPAWDPELEDPPPLDPWYSYYSLPAFWGVGYMHPTVAPPLPPAAPDEETDGPRGHA